MANKIVASRGGQSGLQSAEEAKELIEAYKQQNPEKYEAKKASGQFDTLLARFSKGGEHEEAVKLREAQEAEAKKILDAEAKRQEDLLEAEKKAKRELVEAEEKRVKDEKKKK